MDSRRFSTEEQHDLLYMKHLLATGAVKMPNASPVCGELVATKIYKLVGHKAGSDKLQATNPAEGSSPTQG